VLLDRRAVNVLVPEAEQVPVERHQLPGICGLKFVINGFLVACASTWSGVEPQAEASETTSAAPQGMRVQLLLPTTTEKTLQMLTAGRRGSPNLDPPQSWGAVELSADLAIRPRRA
jgi:hypothetical protein